jgi:SAM-dependent methyltransferase
MTSRTATGGGASKLSASDLQAYWSRVSADFLSRDPEGLAVICYAGLPRWFNAFLDRYQRLAFDRLTRELALAGAEVLDLGTGVGRWATLFSERGAARVVGVDLERDRLGRAAAQLWQGRPDYVQMGVDGLAFAPESFDVVSSVTVLQHVSREVKEQAIVEAARVLRPGGHLILFELTDLHDDAPHVFPESRDSWVALCRASGLRLVRETGDQYTPLLRLAKAALRGRRGRVADFKQGGGGPAATLALRALVLASYPIEEVCQRVLPPGSAKISGFLFQNAIGD